MLCKEYPKIECVFKRDMEGTKKLIPNSFRSPEVEYLANNQWEFTEKIDGTNIRIFWDGHKVNFYGRTDKAQIPSHLMEFLKETFGKIEDEEIFEQLFGEKEVTLYGEGYGIKIQNGGGYRSDVSFILFDVKVGETFLMRKDIEDIAQAFKIDVVPIILTGTVHAGIDYVCQHPKSTIGTAYMEGLVGKPIIPMYDRQGRRVVVKIKWEDFKDMTTLSGV